MKNKLEAKLCSLYPLAEQGYIRSVSDALMNVTEPLLENVRQWAEEEPITDVWIEKYCVRTVMKMRKSSFVDALLSLDRYAKARTPTSELLLWEVRK